jgi:hypothetical protein
MKKNLLFILILIFSIGSAGAQVDFIWGKQFGSDSDERTRNLMIDSLNNVYVVGKTRGKVGKSMAIHGLLLKLTVQEIQMGNTNWFEGRR